MAMQKVLIASSAKEDSLLLKKQLGVIDHEVAQFRFFETTLDRLANLPSELHLAVISTDSVEDSAKQALINLRVAGYHGPTMLLTRGADSDVLQIARKFETVVVLERPYDARDFVGLARKMLTQRKASQRVHRRFPTSQKASLEFLTRESNSEITVRNLSRGGAFFEVDSKVAPQLGEIVKLHIDLDQVNRTYAMPAKIVWTSPSARASSGCGVGVEFVSQGDVYKYLLGDL